MATPTEMATEMATEMDNTTETLAVPVEAAPVAVAVRVVVRARVLLEQPRPTPLYRAIYRINVPVRATAGHAREAV